MFNKIHLLILISLALMSCRNIPVNLTENSTEISAENSESLRLATIFSDHMILQRSQPIKVWGWAEQGQQVNISLISNDIEHTVATETNAQGKWLVTLPAQQSGDSYQLIVSTGNDKQIVNDILFGDVWLASGQSNMEWKLGWKVDNWQQEVANSENNDIRFFEIENSFNASEQQQLTSGEWQIASPENAANFSAVAWHFAKLHQQEQQVPVAIIDSTWGGTPAEAWLSLPALSTVSGYQQQAANMLNNREQLAEKFAQNAINETLKWQMIADDSYYKNGQVLSLGFDDKHWHTTLLPTPTSQPLNDIVWLRKKFTLATIPEKATINVGEMNQVGKVLLNGTMIYQEDWQDTTKIADIEPSLLIKGDNIIAMRVINSWDNNVIVGKTDNLWLQLDDNRYDLQGEWRFSNRVEPPLPQVKNYNWEASVLYNAMIKPITNYALKGVIWYQGESNADKPHLYAELFTRLITDWRQQFQQEELPFLFVQLASYMKQQPQPKESQWAELRQAQTEALRLPNTGMAVTIDIGDANDVHPRNKADVGKRLWQAAKHIAFNESVIFSGPVFSSAKVTEIDGETGLLISYQRHQPLQTKGNDLLGFALANADNNFVNAHARIIQQRDNQAQVFVYHPNIKAPHAVRYAWADNSPANLYNHELLPAVPFQHHW